MSTSKNRKRKERRRRQAVAKFATSMDGSGGGEDLANMFAALRSDEATAGDEGGDLGRGAAADAAPQALNKKGPKKRRRDNEYRSVVEDNRKKIEQFAAGPPAGGGKGKSAGGGQDQLVLGGSLNELEKRLLGELARNELGLDATEGPPPKHTLRISRPADWAKRKAEREDEERRARKARGGKPRPFTAATLPTALRNRSSSSPLTCVWCVCVCVWCACASATGECVRACVR
jgi:hypothetical protein